MRHIRWTVVCSLALAACAFAGAANPTPKHLAVLNSDASMEKKAEACRLLAGGGDASAIPTLAKMLVDPKLSHMARYALEPMPFPEAGTALRNALSTLKGDLLLGAIHSVGMRKDEAAVTSLTRLLGAPETAAAAAMALGRIATPEAAQALAPFRKTAKDRMVVFAGDASLRAARGLVARGEPKLAAAICTELQAKSWPPHIRLGAFTCLLTADPAEAPARILQAVASDDPKLRATAIAQIPALKGKNVIAQFAAELPKSPPAVQALLLRALARRPDAKGALGPVVTQLIQSPDADVRRIAVQTLGAVGDAGSVPALCALLAKGEPAAATSLRALNGKGVNAAILAAMKAAPPAARPALITVLADRKAVEAVDELVGQAKDKDVRASALKAIARLATAEHLPALLTLLTETKGDAGRAEAERAVIQISRQLPKAQSGPALAALGKAKDTPTRCSLLRVLGGIADAPALAAVSTASADKDAAIQDTALRTLAAWPDAAPLDALSKIARTTKNPTHRVLALRGCVRMAGLGDTPATKAVGVLTDLAAGAKGPDDRKLVLSGLAAIAHPAALEAIEPFLKDAATRNEAELATLAVARAIMGSAPAEAKSAAARLAKSKNAAVRKQAAGILATMDRLGGYITAWQVAGPYEQRGKDGAALIDVAFAPEKADAKGVAWKPLPVNAASKTPWMLDLFSGPDRACYVRTWVHSAKAQKARIELGDDDGSKIWLNGKIVHASAPGGVATPGEHKIPIALLAGWNPVLMKVTQYSGPWQFCFRIRAADGDEMDGIRVQAMPPEK